MEKEQFIREALSLPTDAIGYHIGQYLSTRYPDKELLEGEDLFFNVEEFAKSGNCTIEEKASVYNQIITHWNAHDFTALPFMIRSARTFIPEHTSNKSALSEQAQNTWLEVTWQGVTFEIIIMHWVEAFNSTLHYWLLADDKVQAREFFETVCQWNAEVRGEVLVFDGGCWHKDAQLFQAIQGSVFENLILKGELKETLRRDIEQFFAARETYATYNIPWKRGILFVGPPGNGKTHTVKAIINTMKQPCLYVKSVHAEHKTDEDNIRAVFERARKTAPCILVLEDLDSLLTPQNRSFFLNELDGFAANNGIITLATTNHPERLDPSILDRPSRFDRKYPFDLPEQAEREAYIVMWNTTLQESLRISESMIVTISEMTEGFSFAYLKELFLSALMGWISSSTQQENLEQILQSQVQVLREQMLSPMVQAAEKESEEAQKNLPPSAWARRRA